MSNLSDFLIAGIYPVFKDANYTAKSNELVWVDTSSSALTITLPASPNPGATVRVGDSAQNAAVNNITIARNGNTINGLAEDFVIDENNGVIDFIWNGTTWAINVPMFGTGGLTEAQVDARVVTVTPTVYSGWTPSNLATAPKLWFNEESRFNLISGGCSQWNNKGSIVDGNLVQATTSKRPSMQPALLAGKNVLSWDGDDDVLFGSSETLAVHRNIDYAWIFGLYYLDSSNTDEAVILYSTTGVTTGTRVGLFGSFAGGANYTGLGARRLDADSFTSASEGTEDTDRWVMALGVADFGEDVLTLYVDGEQIGQNVDAFGATGNTSDTDSQALTVGANGTETQNGLVDIAEAFTGTSSGGTSELSAADIDKLFGYAAHKWGLIDNLDGSHPYKNSAPTT